MKEILCLIGFCALAFFSGRGIGKDVAQILNAKKEEELKSEISELEILKMKVAYLEGVKSCQNGEDWQDRWAEIQDELEKAKQ